MNNVIGLPASTTMTVQQALDSTKEMAARLTDVLIVAYDDDGDLFVRSSRMDRKDALWMSEMLRLYALGGSLANYVDGS